MGDTSQEMQATRSGPLSLPTMHRLAMANLAAQVIIAVTGTVVRVTGSGLGCPQWPQCDPGSLAPTPRPDIAPLLQWIEFGNRLLGMGVVLLSVACILAARRVHPRPRRLVALAAVMPAGAVIQAVVGGITVLVDLAWWSVVLHFLPSMLLVWFAVQLVSVTSRHATPPKQLVAPAGRALVAASAAVLLAVLVAGTLVTAAGPHAGDAATPRLDADPSVLTGVHACLLAIHLALLVMLGVVLRRTQAPADVQTRYRVLVIAVVAQGALGGLQYALGVPEVLVLLHVLGAALVVAASSAVWAVSLTRPVVTDPMTL